MIPRYAPRDMAALFSDEARFEAMLEVELLAAEALATLGVVLSTVLVGGGVWAASTPPPPPSLIPSDPFRGMVSSEAKGTQARGGAGRCWAVTGCLLSQWRRNLIRMLIGNPGARHSPL